jgi:catechol 2,3-dioxygenase-like lactoylglutathione lyase family enzyme
MPAKTHHAPQKCFCPSIMSHHPGNFMISLSHNGICVADLNRSEDFYTAVLGFLPYQDHGVISGPEMEKSFDIPGIKMHCKMLKHPSGSVPVIELVHVMEPGVVACSGAGEGIRYGFSHLTFGVEDIDATASEIARAGGTVHHETRLGFPDSDLTMICCSDPDGVRLELIQSDDAPAFLHRGICVRDLDVSLRYYDKLGFRPVKDRFLDGDAAWLATISGMPEARVRCQIVSDAEGNRIELRELSSSRSYDPPVRKMFNQIGLTQIAFWDDDPRSTISRLTECGGYFIEDGHVKTPLIELSQGADPDEVWIELLTAAIPMNMLRPDK